MFAGVALLRLILDNRFLHFREVKMPEDIQGSIGLIDLLKVLVTGGKKDKYSASKVAKKLLVASCVHVELVTWFHL